MNLIEFPEQTVVIAKDQPQYLPMPAHKLNDSTGTVTCCWKLSFKERLAVLFRGVIWHQIWSFNAALQPQRLSVEKPALCQSRMIAESRIL